VLGIVCRSDPPTRVVQALLQARRAAALAIGCSADSVTVCGESTVQLGGPAVRRWDYWRTRLSRLDPIPPPYAAREFTYSWVTPGAGHVVVAARGGSVHLDESVSQASLSADEAAVVTRAVQRAAHQSRRDLVCGPFVTYAARSPWEALSWRAPHCPMYGYAAVRFAPCRPHGTGQNTICRTRVPTAIRRLLHIARGIKAQFAGCPRQPLRRCHPRSLVPAHEVARIHKLVEVPSVLGFGPNSAACALAHKKLRYRWIGTSRPRAFDRRCKPIRGPTHPSSDGPLQVVTQAPAPGRHVRRGHTVTLRVKATLAS
jgi:hypothetical protein